MSADQTQSPAERRFAKAADRAAFVSTIATVMAIVLMYLLQVQPRMQEMTAARVDFRASNIEAQQKMYQAKSDAALQTVFLWAAAGIVAAGVPMSFLLLNITKTTQAAWKNVFVLCATPLMPAAFAVCALLAP
jgi:hypothetical protein